MQILYVISLLCFVVLAVAAFALARHIRKASAVAAELEKKKPVRPERVVTARTAQRKLRKAS